MIKYRLELRVGDICRWHKNLFCRYDIPINSDGSYFLKRDTLIVLEVPADQDGQAGVKVFHMRKGAASKTLIANRRDIWFTGKNAYAPVKKIASGYSTQISV